MGHSDFVLASNGAPPVRRRETMIFEEGFSALSNLEHWYDENKSTRNEATTRFRLIDSIFFECLGWSKDDAVLEEAQGREYTDYVFLAPRRMLIVEAKREGYAFDLPAGQARLEMGIHALLKIHPSIEIAIAQAAGYCQKRGVPVAAVTNGHQIIAFIGSRNDATPPLEGRALVFSSFEEMKNHFIDLWDALSKPGIEEKRILHRLTSGAPKLPQKLSAVIKPYPGVIERNVIQSDLQVLSDIILEDIVPSPDLEAIFLAECYTASGALAQFSLASKQILETRYAEMFADDAVKPVVLPAVSKTGVSPELMRVTFARRPILLLGDVGVGKTTFIRNLIKVEAATLFERSIAIHLNLGTQAALAIDFRLYVLDEIDKQLRQNYHIDVNEAAFVRTTYATDLRRLETSIFGELKHNNPERYAEEELAELARLTANRSEHLRRSLHNLVNTRRTEVIIFLDNADQRDELIQESAFLMAQEISQQWPALVFVSLRPETFNRSQRSGALSGYYTKAFAISPPSIDDVIRKRLNFALKITTGKIPVTRLQHVGIKLENLTAIIRVLLRSLQRDARLFELLENLSGGNVRAALELLNTFIGSGHVNTQRMLNVERYIVSPHEFTRAIIYGDSLHFDPSRSLVANIFDISSEDGREHFLLPLVIGFLDRSGDTAGNGGFVETQYLYDSLQAIGFSPDQIDFAVSRGINAKLIQTSGRIIPTGNEEMPSSMRVTPSGLYHAYRLAGNFQYLDAMIVDTPILPDSAREKMRVVEDIADRLVRAEVFVKEYLDHMWTPLSGRAIGFDWMEISYHAQQEIQSIRWRLVNRPTRRKFRR
jgi:GTPase SAR1 family protein